MDFNILLSQVIAAVQAKQWVLFAALLIGFVIALAKQGWLSTWIASKMPSRAIPYYAAALGVLSLMVTDITSGKTLTQAIQDGLAAAMLSVFGHELVIESMRKGKELIPSKRPAPANDNNTPDQKVA